MAGEDGPVVPNVPQQADHHMRFYRLSQHCTSVCRICWWATSCWTLRRHIAPDHAATQLCHHKVTRCGSSHAQSVSRTGRCQRGPGCTPVCAALPEAPCSNHIPFPKPCVPHMEHRTPQAGSQRLPQHQVPALPGCLCPQSAGVF